jgi:hypothetical protein
LRRHDHIADGIDELVGARATLEHARQREKQAEVETSGKWRRCLGAVLHVVLVDIIVEAILVGVELEFLYD